MVDNFLATGRRGWLRASWGGLLSLTIPGLGQVYARAWRIGLTLIAATLLLEALARGCTRVFPPTPAMMTALVLPGIGLSLAVRSGAAWDAVRRIRRRSDQAPQTWKGSTWLAAILVIALDVALDQSIPAGWRAFSIPSGSNIPTLIVGDRFFADIRDPGFVPLAGDMVVFRHPRDPSVEFVKRVVGLPGERVQMKGGYLYIDGQAAPREPAGEIEDEGARYTIKLRRYFETLPNGRRYAIAKATDEGGPNNTKEFVVPPGHFFALGDNRDDSVDSRFPEQLGYVPFANVIGKAGAIYWARDRSRILSNVD